MNRTLYIVLMVAAALWYLAMFIVNAVAGNVGGAVGFGCTTILVLGIMFVTLDLYFYIDNNKKLTDLCNKTIKENGSLVELNEKICNTNQEVCSQNRKLIDDNDKLFLTVNKMKKYLTVAELEEVNREIAGTGYKFLENDGEFEMFVTRKRKEVSD